MRKVYHCTFLKKSQTSNLTKPKYATHLVFNKDTVVGLLEQQSIYGRSFSFQQIPDRKFLWSFSLKKKSWLAASQTKIHKLVL